MRKEKDRTNSSSESYGGRSIRLKHCSIHQVRQSPSLYDLEEQARAETHRMTLHQSALTDSNRTIDGEPARSVAAL